MSPGRAGLVAGAATAGLVAVIVALAWVPDSPVVPSDGSHSPDGTAPWVLVSLIAAFVAYLFGLRQLRHGARLAAVLAIAVAVQVIPVAAPLLLSTDAWTYWGYADMALDGTGNPYVDPPAASPSSPATPYVGADWLDTTSVYGPVFTLASEPLALVIGDSPERAAWLFKALAAAATLAAAALAARIARRPALALALVGWNPVIAVHMGGGGHNDAWVGALITAALVLAANGRRRTSSVVWALAVLVKWVPLLFLLLTWLVPSRLKPRPPVLIALIAFVSLGLVATSRYGPDWLGAVAPLVDNAARETSYALPARLEQLGLQRSVALAIAAIAFGVGLGWLALQSRRGTPRLGLAACLVLATTPYLAVWYLGWAIPLVASDDEDTAALAGGLVLTAYLLPQTIPL